MKAIVRSTLLVGLGAALLGPPAGAATAKRLDLNDCRVAGVEETLRCGSLTVPENPRRSSGRKIELHIVILPAIAPRDPQVPLFDLAGGPGLAASGAAAFFATAGRIHRQHRDVVLVDQRGTGESSPLHCPELESHAPMSSMYPAEAVRRCREALQAQGIDLSQYTTANSADDLDAVRQALGHGKVDLSALSYGTRLALAYIAQHPERVRAAALIGTTTSDAKLPLWHAHHAQETLEAVFQDCARDAACVRAFPQLSEQWRLVRANVDSADRRLERGPLMERFRTLLATARGQSRLPALIDRMSRGDFQPLLAESADGIAEGLYLSVTCMEDTQWISPAEREMATVGTFLGAYRIDEQMRACQEWKLPRVKIPAAERIQVPLLLIAGERDYVTPARWARKVADTAADGRVIVIPRLGHFPDGLAHLDCLDAMLAEFFTRGRTAGVDDACVARMTPPPFEIPR